MPDDVKKREQKSRDERLKIKGDPIKAMKHFLSKKPKKGQKSDKREKE